jgi:hypothetical protein
VNYGVRRRLTFIILLLIKNGPWAPWRGHAPAHLSLTRWPHQHTTRTCRLRRAVAPGKRRPDVLGGRRRQQGQPQEPPGWGGGCRARRSGGLARRRHEATEEVVRGARARRGEREERGHRPVLLPRPRGGGRGGARGRDHRRCMRRRAVRVVDERLRVTPSHVTSRPSLGAARYVRDLGGVATGAGTSMRPWQKGEALEEGEGGREVERELWGFGTSGSEGN